jgi:hypothetical protein
LNVEDARALALELADLRPALPVDTMALGVVLEPGERAHRVCALWLRLRLGGQWSAASWCQVLVTDRRLLVRFPTGELVSLWWGSLVGFDAHLKDAYVVLDFGDGRPRLVAGPDVSTVAVAGVAHLYGVEALTRHDALACIRQPAME